MYTPTLYDIPRNFIERLYMKNIEKIILVYHKEMKVQRFKKRFIGEISRAGVSCKSPKIGIKYDIVNRELTVAGPHAVALLVDEIVFDWFNCKGHVKDCICRRDKKKGIIGRYTMIMYCTKDKWKMGKHRCIFEKYNNSDLWTVKINVKLGRTIN